MRSRAGGRWRSMPCSICSISMVWISGVSPGGSAPAQLERLMSRQKSEARHLTELWDDGAALLRAAGGQGLEGIVSKLRSSTHHSGPTDA